MIVLDDMLDGAGPFHYKGNKIGILIIHGGGGGTCADLKPLAEDLHKKGGYTIQVPLLPGFGTNPKRLRKTKPEAFKNHLNEEIESLKQKCEKIIVGGHSMGGLLTLIMASSHKFDGLFTISAPTGILLPYSIFKLLRLVITHFPYIPIEYDKLKMETDDKWVGYKKLPINMGFKINKLLKEMKESIPKVECPTLIMQGRLDSDIKPESMDNIFNGIKSANKRKVWLENNDHPILDSPDHDQVVEELITFINNICSKK